MSNKGPPDRMISMKSNQSFHTLSRISISGGHNFILKNSMGWPQVSIADLSIDVVYFVLRAQVYHHYGCHPNEEMLFGELGFLFPFLQFF